MRPAAGSRLFGRHAKPRICKFGPHGAAIEVDDDCRVASCTAKGPCTVLSMQSAVDSTLAWTLQVRGSTNITVGAVSMDFDALDGVPDEPAWLVTSAAGQRAATAVACEAGDRFTVVADLREARLTVHHAAGGGKAPLRCVLDTDTLRGPLRLCATLFAGATLELRKMRVVEPVSLQEEYEAALQALEPALGPEDPTTLSAQHNLGQICFARAQECLRAGAGREAEALFAEATQMMGLAHAGRSVVLGEAHPHTRKSALALASIRHAGCMAQLVPIYTAHSPAKLRGLEELVSEWEGEEEALLRQVRAKYGVVTEQERRAAAEQEAQAQRAERAAEQASSTAALVDRFLADMEARDMEARGERRLTAEEQAAEAERRAVEDKRRRRAKERKQAESGRPPVESRVAARKALAQSVAAGQGAGGGGDLDAVEQMRQWALEVEQSAPRVHGSRTMYM